MGTFAAAGQSKRSNRVSGMNHHYKDIRISDYNYPCRRSAIAKYPLREQDHSSCFTSHPMAPSASTSLLRPAATAVAGRPAEAVNDTRVINARSSSIVPRVARIEVFCLDPSRTAIYEGPLPAGQACLAALHDRQRIEVEGAAPRPVSEGGAVTAERISEKRSASPGIPASPLPNCWRRWANCRSRPTCIVLRRSRTASLIKPSTHVSKGASPHRRRGCTSPIGCFGSPERAGSSRRR